jgi:hypothetical protein
MKLRYYKDKKTLVPKPLRHLSDAELGRETYTVERAEDGNALASTPKDDKQERNADFEHMRSRIRGEHP